MTSHKSGYSSGLRVEWLLITFTARSDPTSEVLSTSHASSGLYPSLNTASRFSSLKDIANTLGVGNSDLSYWLTALTNRKGGLEVDASICATLSIISLRMAASESGSLLSIA